MGAYVAACALWVGGVQPLLAPAGASPLQTIGLVAFLGLAGSLLYRAFSAQTLQLSAARAAQLEAEQHLRALVDHSPTRISFKDAEGRFLLVNRSFAEWFGADATTIAGRSASEIYPPELAATYEAMDLEVKGSGIPQEFHVRHQRNGQIRISSLVKFPVHGPDGVLAGLGTIATDATEKIEAEAALRRAKEAADAANRAKTHFLAAMSHELRTPLNAIIGFAEMLTGSSPVRSRPDQVREYGEAIQQSGRHLLGIINDILDISRVEAGKVALNEEVVSVCGVVEEALNLIAARAQAAGLRIATTIPDNCPKLRVDEQRLRQILVNLLSNAVKFTPSGGAIEIGVEQGADFRIRVTDTGIGMREEDIPQALALFGQVDCELQRSYEGTGLGLPLSKSLAELHGGTLEVTSRPGEGTTVSIVLPGFRVAAEQGRRSEGANLRSAAGAR